MFVQTKGFTVSRALATLILNALVVAVPAAILDVTSKVKLYKSGPVLGQSMVAADFTEPVFPGYAAVTLASVIGPLNVPGGPTMHKEIDFLCTGTNTPNEDILGVFITDSAGTTVLAAEQFSSPVPIAVAGDGVSYDLILGPKVVWGGVNGV